LGKQGLLNIYGWALGRVTLAHHQVYFQPTKLKALLMSGHLSVSSDSEHAHCGGRYEDLSTRIPTPSEIHAALYTGM
jgi:hypothetical protein